MFRRRSLLALALVASACKEGASTPTIASPSDPTTTPKTIDAPAPSPAPTPAPMPTTSASALTGFPPLTDACSTDADCASTNYGPDCCFRCETSVGDKAWAAKVDAYCQAEQKAGRVKGCVSMPCSRESTKPSPMLAYVNAIPKCMAGRCGKPH